MSTSTKKEDNAQKKNFDVLNTCRAIQILYVITDQKHMAYFKQLLPVKEGFVFYIEEKEREVIAISSQQLIESMKPSEITLELAEEILEMALAAGMLTKQTTDYGKFAYYYWH